MHRIACLALPRWPLQLLRRAHPEWADAPVVVVAEERTNAELLLLDDRARALGLDDRMRLGTAQSLAPELRAGIVTPEAIDAAVSVVLEVLRRHCPRIEVEGAGLFFLDPSGLRGLYGSERTWAEVVHAEVRGLGYEGALVVGFGRHRTRALATSAEEPVTVLPDEATERARVAGLPLERFGVSPALREALALLGIHTCEALRRLPPLELAARFGSEALALHQAIDDDLARPLAPTHDREPVEESLEVDPPDHDVERLLFVVKAMLDRLLPRLDARGEAATRLTMILALEHAPPHRESLEPSAPTHESKLLVELVRLRLGRAVLVAPVTELTLRLDGIRRHGRQTELLEAARLRDPEAAARAIARLHATFGPTCTSHPGARDAHTPEARGTWATTKGIALPGPLLTDPVPLVRRVPTTPRPLDVRLASLGVVDLHGPYRIDGRWWSNHLSRDYYFAETESGAVLWLYREARSGRWFSYGELD